MLSPKGCVRVATRFDVGGLCPLVASSQQNHDFAPDSFEIYPVARAVIDPHLRNSLAHRLDIARITRSETLDPNLHPRSRTNVAQPVKPMGENFGLADL
jgi:hypothetical protein